MPYSYGQCQAFATKAARGEKVPADWRKHCRGVQKPRKKKAKKKSSK